MFSLPRGLPCGIIFECGCRNVDLADYVDKRHRTKPDRGANAGGIGCRHIDSADYVDKHHRNFCECGCRNVDLADYVDKRHRNTPRGEH